MNMRTIENTIKATGLKELNGREMFEVNGGSCCRGPAFAFGRILVWMGDRITSTAQAMKQVQHLHTW